MTSITIEVCVDSVESAVNAVKGGADRLEICSSVGVGGGLTPSIGLVRAIERTTPSSTQLMVMIRPRMGDFCYSEAEFQVMLNDIDAFQRENVHGFVFGVLQPSGHIDAERTQRLVAASFPFQVCFHRAFDMVVDPQRGTLRNLQRMISAIIRCIALSDVTRIGGITRILTSGHAPHVTEGLPVVTELLNIIDSGQLQISILPGSGVNPGTVLDVLRLLVPLGVREIHLSGGQWIRSEMSYRQPGMGMGVGEAEWHVWRASEETIRTVRQKADEFVQGSGSLSA